MGVALRPGYGLEQQFNHEMDNLVTSGWQFTANLLRFRCEGWLETVSKEGAFDDSFSLAPRAS